MYQKINKDFAINCIVSSGNTVYIGSLLAMNYNELIKMNN